MKRLYSLLFFLPVFVILSCAHRPATVTPVSPPAQGASSAQKDSLKSPEPPASPAIAGKKENGSEAKSAIPPVSPPGKSDQPGTESAAGKESPETEEAGETAAIADPLEPFNRAMFQFNDRLYFWVLKPVALQYNKLVPERGRVGVNNFFYNLRFPGRFVSCLLQANFECVGSELGRFAVNTVWGLGGLLDPASSEQLNIPKRKADLGQTLGVYGVGQGFYIVLPVLGPYSARDTVDIAGDYFLYPVNYITPWYAWLGVRSYETVNVTSLRIGDYESLKEAAIDPYVALRDAYIQYRQKMVEGARAKTAPPQPGGVNPSSSEH